MHNWLVFLTTLLFAIVLALIPLPESVVWFRPAWVLVLLIYWVISHPDSVNIGIAWLVGLLMDLLTGSLLGEHALAYTVVIYFVSRMHIRLRMYPLIQQTVTILFFTLLYLFIIFCLQGFIGALPGSQLYWFSAITSMLLWPWLLIVMRNILQRYHIA